MSYSFFYCFHFFILLFPSSCNMTTTTCNIKNISSYICCSFHISTKISSSSSYFVSLQFIQKQSPLFTTNGYYYPYRLSNLAHSKSIFCWKFQFSLKHNCQIFEIKFFFNLISFRMSLNDNYINLVYT